MITLAAIALGLAVWVQVPPPRTAQSVLRSWDKLKADAVAIRQTEATQLNALADRLVAQNQRTEGDAVRKWIESAGPRNGPLRIVPLPEVVPLDSAVAVPSPELKQIRDRTARALFELARRAAAPELEFLALADACLRGVLDRDPGHREARRLLGYVEHDGGWATPQAAQYLKDGLALHPTFGWVKADWVPHLEQGELPGLIERNRPIDWLPADQANALRAGDWRLAWTITTEHFRITTNVPLAEAIGFGRRLEALHDIFFSLFADVIGRELPLARRFRDPKLWAKAAAKKYEVWYFATKDEYVRHFRNKFQQDQAGSLGYYMPPSEAKGWKVVSRSYFYRDAANPISSNETLFHEGSHQLLFESAGPTSFGRNRGNYWVWEGLGTYFETLAAQRDGSYQIGGLIGPRIAKAHDDIVAHKRLVPTAELVALNKAEFSAEPAAFLHYSEAMALAVFLMHAEGGRYRERFLDYVSDGYRGLLNKPDSARKALSSRIELPYKELDAQLVKFLEQGLAPP